MRTKTVQVLLTPAEHREALRLAKMRGLALSAFFRLMLNTEAVADKARTK